MTVHIDRGWIERFAPTSLGGLLVVLASIVVSFVARGLLPASVRIRWAVGTHYGPEYAPTLLVLSAFPATIALLYVGFRLLGRRLENAGAFGAESAETAGGVTVGRFVYETCVLATLCVMVAVQIALVAANVYL